MCVGAHTHVCACVFMPVVVFCVHTCVFMPVVVLVVVCVSVHTYVFMLLVDQILYQKALRPCSRRQSLQIKLRACCWNCFPWPAYSDSPSLPSEGGITARHHWSSSILVSSWDSNSSFYTHLTTELSPRPSTGECLKALCTSTWVI